MLCLLVAKPLTSTSQVTQIYPDPNVDPVPDEVADVWGITKYVPGGEGITVTGDTLIDLDYTSTFLGVQTNRGADKTAYEGSGYKVTRSIDNIYNKYKINVAEFNNKTNEVYLTSEDPKITFTNNTAIIPNNYFEPEFDITINHSNASYTIDVTKNSGKNKNQNKILNRTTTILRNAEDPSGLRVRLWEWWLNNAASFTNSSQRLTTQTGPLIYLPERESNIHTNRPYTITTNSNFHFNLLDWSGCSVWQNRYGRDRKVAAIAPSWGTMCHHNSFGLNYDLAIGDIVTFLATDGTLVSRTIAEKIKPLEDFTLLKFNEPLPSTVKKYTLLHPADVYKIANWSGVPGITLNKLQQAKVSFFFTKFGNLYGVQEHNINFIGDKNDILALPNDSFMEGKTELLENIDLAFPSTFIKGDSSSPIFAIDSNGEMILTVIMAGATGEGTPICTTYMYNLINTTIAASGESVTWTDFSQYEDQYQRASLLGNQNYANIETIKYIKSIERNQKLTLNTNNVVRKMNRLVDADLQDWYLDETPTIEEWFNGDYKINGYSFMHQDYVHRGDLDKDYAVITNLNFNTVFAEYTYTNNIANNLEFNVVPKVIAAIDFDLANDFSSIYNQPADTRNRPAFGSAFSVAPYFTAWQENGLYKVYGHIANVYINDILLHTFDTRTASGTIIPYRAALGESNIGDVIKVELIYVGAGTTDAVILPDYIDFVISGEAEENWSINYLKQRQEY